MFIPSLLVHYFNQRINFFVVLFDKASIARFTAMHYLHLTKADWLQSRPDKATDLSLRVWFSGGGWSYLVALPFSGFNINLQMGWGRSLGWVGLVALKFSLRRKVPQKIISMFLMPQPDSQTSSMRKQSSHSCCVLDQEISQRRHRWPHAYNLLPIDLNWTRFIFNGQVSTAIRKGNVQ